MCSVPSIQPRPHPMGCRATNKTVTQPCAGDPPLRLQPRPRPSTGDHPPTADRRHQSRPMPCGKSRYGLEVNGRLFIGFKVGEVRSRQVPRRKFCPHQIIGLLKAGDELGRIKQGRAITAGAQLALQALRLRRVQANANGGRNIVFERWNDELRNSRRAHQTGANAAGKALAGNRENRCTHPHRVRSCRVCAIGE